MTRIVVTGERGEVTQSVRVGPAMLVRPQVWDDLPRLAKMVRTAGYAVEAHDPAAPVADHEEPDCWLLSDLPFAAAVANGLYSRLVARDGRAGMMMLGGALSFAGQQGVGGWAGANDASIWPVLVDTASDAVEAPEGLRLLATDDCPERLETIVRSTPPVFGYNRVTPRPRASVFAEMSNGAPAIVMMERDGRRRLVFTSDLMPHWGADLATWDELPAFIGSLLELVLE
jgi:hypothetical protein